MGRAVSEVRRIHITGASGSGVTTLGASIARSKDWRHLDTDDYFWLPTSPPYQTQRSVPERLELLANHMAGQPGWVLSGSLEGWGDPLIPQFDLVVFLFLPPDTRIVRIRAREQARFGTQIEPGGAMHETHEAFVAWARGYDRQDGASGRNLQKHRDWLARLDCPVLEITGEPTREESLARVLAAIEA
jgi:adenylate kinase family enzyme